VKAVTEEYPFLLDYFGMLPLDKIGLPVYYPEPTRKLGTEKKMNFIYPTLRKGVFVHILSSPNSYRNAYIPLEPTLFTDYTPLIRLIDVKLLELKNELRKLMTDGTKEEQLVACVDKVTVPADEAELVDADTANKHKNPREGAGGRIKMTPKEIAAVKYMFVRNRVGLSVLEPLISDPFIEDISCSGTGQIFIEHKIFKSLKTSVTFDLATDLDEYVLWLAERIRKPVTFRNPIADAALPDGSRINIVYGRDVSRRGSNFTIRKFAGTPTSIFELIEFGSLNYQMLAYLALAIGNGMNLFVSGETASGKTTLLNAITTFIHPMAKIVSIEDTPELQVPHKNWIREVVQSTKPNDTSGAVNMFDLLKAALRQRPNEIIIGEIRGAEGNIAFQAMQTGHSVMATFHAASVEKLIQRITGAPISVPKTYLDNLNVVVLTSMVKLPNGKMGRRVTGIAEIAGYDPVQDTFSFIESFHWNESKDIFEFPGNMTSYVLEQKIAPKLGIPTRKKQRIYAEMERRAKILEKLHREQGVTGFYEVLEVLSKAQREGLF
jgi:flagellar protein FlaI